MQNAQYIFPELKVISSNVLQEILQFAQFVPEKFWHLIDTNNNYPNSF